MPPRIQIYSPAVLGLAVSFLLVTWLIARLVPQDRKGLRVAWIIQFATVLTLWVFVSVTGLREPTGGLIPIFVLVYGAAVMHALGIATFRYLLPRLKVHAPRIVQDVAMAAAYFGWGVVNLSWNGVNISSIVATSAVLTAVIGFSLQDTLGNMLGGLSIQIDHSVEVGDWINVDSVEGRVVEIRWRYTALETRDWETIIVPNSFLVKNRIRVLGRRAGEPELWRRRVRFNVDFRFSPDTVISTVERALRIGAIPRVSPVPEPHCILVEFQESYAVYEVRYWLTDLAANDPGDSEVRIRIFNGLRRAAISLSIPAQAVFVTEETMKRKAHKREELLSAQLKALGHVDFFQGLTEEEMRRLAERLVPTPFSRGETITRQGDTAHWLYLIIRGTVEVVVTGADGSSLHVANLGPGQFFGEMALMTGEPRNATVLASSEVESYRLDKEAFREIIQTRPELAEEISTMLARRRTELEAVRESLDAAAHRERLKSMHSQILDRIRSFFSLQ